MFKVYWVISYNHILLNFWGLTSVNFGNRLNCCGFNTQKKIFIILFNYVIQTTTNYNENID